MERSSKLRFSLIQCYLSEYYKMIDNDIISLLIQGESTSGSFNHASWQIKNVVDSASSAARLTSIHESLHNELNQATAYGLVLQIIAYLSRETQEERYQKLLADLVKRCRTTHEIYATYLSTIIVTNTKDNHITVETLLAPYPDYFPYYSNGVYLTKYFNGRYLKQHALLSLIRICFQSTTIINYFVEHLAAPQLGKIPFQEFPDSRLTFFSKQLDQDFWQKALDEFYEAHADEAFVIALKANEVAPSYLGYNELIQEENDTLSAKLIQVFESHLQALLLSHQQNTLIGAAHLEYLDSLYQQADLLFPFSKAKTPLLPNPKPFDENLHSLSNFENEILVISETPFEGHFHHLSDFKTADWPKFSSGTGENEHFFISIRLKERLLTQYSFTEQEKLRLETFNQDLFICLRRSLVKAGKRMVEFLLIETPEQLMELHQLTPTIRKLCSTSMLAFADKDWNEQWQHVLQKTTRNTLLFNLSPFRQLMNSFDQFQATLYQKVLITVGEETHTVLCFCGILNEDTLLLYLMPCSELACNSTITFIRQYLDQDKFIEHASFTERFSWDLRVIIGHLLREEPSFDFRVLQSHFAKQKFQDNGFY